MSESGSGVDTYEYGWIVVPAAFASLLYCTALVMWWPYARPLFPLTLVVFAILFPPFFFFAALYTILMVATLPPATRVVVLPVNTRHQTARLEGGTRRVLSGSKAQLDPSPRRVHFASGGV